VPLTRFHFPLAHIAPGHFLLFLLCAFLASCALQLRLGCPVVLLVRGLVRTLLIFVLTGVTLAWLIYPLSH